jgi:hypothetical protein
MLRRRRFKQSLSLNDRLKLFSDKLRARAAELRPGTERDALLKKARIADTTANGDQWRPANP